MGDRNVRYLLEHQGHLAIVEADSPAGAILKRNFLPDREADVFTVTELPEPLGMFKIAPRTVVKLPSLPLVEAINMYQAEQNSNKMPNTDDGFGMPPPGEDIPF